MAYVVLNQFYSVKELSGLYFLVGDVYYLAAGAIDIESPHHPVHRSSMNKVKMYNDGSLPIIFREEKMNFILWDYSELDISDFDTFVFYIKMVDKRKRYVLRFFYRNVINLPKVVAMMPAALIQPCQAELRKVYPLRDFIKMKLPVENGHIQFNGSPYYDKESDCARFTYIARLKVANSYLVAVVNDNKILWVTDNIIGKYNDINSDAKVFLTETNGEYTLIEYVHIK
jgi:hypothetical protein